VLQKPWELIIILIIDEPLKEAGTQRMYVCICNAISDRQARSHTDSAGCSVAAFYRALGVKPKCGKCVPAVREMLASGGTSPDSRQDSHAPDA
jgi:bacterioferritin-associated ferredoxin